MSPSNPAITITNVSKSFDQTCALNNLSLEVTQGEFFGLLGPNGAGKTTLISSLAGLTKPDSGTIEVLGINIKDHPELSRKNIGVVPQELAFDPFFTIEETLKFQSGYFGIHQNQDWVQEILENLGLTIHAKKMMRALSGGMKRRVLVAQALVHRPPIIVLDEPTAGVDIDLRQGLWRFIQKLHQDGHTIILTTHYLEEAQSHCDRIGIMKEGELVALDTKKNLLEQFSSDGIDLEEAFLRVIN